MSGDHSVDLIGREHKLLTLAEGRAHVLDKKPDHAIREETIGKEGIAEAAKRHEVTLEEHREARAEMTVNDPDTHNKNVPRAHHHEQHAQHHSAGEEHKAQQ